MSSLSKKELLVQKIKAEVDIERLTDLLANDFLLQQAAQELKQTINEVEKGVKNGQNILLVKAQK